MASKDDIDSLRMFTMLADLAPWQLEMVAESVEAFHADPGGVVVARGSDDGYTYFLSSGEVRLEAADGGVRTLASDGPGARTPIANLRPRIFTVTALDEVRGLRVPDIALNAAGCDGHVQSAIVVESQEEGERNELDSRLSFQLYQDLMNDEAILPSLPAQALQIRRAIDEEGSDARSIARLVEADPAMAAKLLKVANSALYGGLDGVETCSAAVVRLGLQTTRQLVTTFALKEVFDSDDPLIRRHMVRLWKHSAQIAALCFVLAREVAGMDAEEALLAGLVHDVGAIAILNYAKRFPALAGDSDMLEQTMVRLRGELGAMILRKWNFPASLVAAAREAENWLRSHNGAADFCDLLITAQVHELLRRHELEGLPSFDRISAVQRVLGPDASPEHSLQILREAKTRVDQMRSLLNG